MTFSAMIHCNGCDETREAHSDYDIPEGWTRIDLLNDQHDIMAQFHLCGGCDQLADPDSLSAAVQADRLVVMTGANGDGHET